MKRVLGIAALVLLAAFVLAGCSKKEEAAAGGTGAAAGAVTEVSLKYWGSEQEVQMQQTAAIFNAKNNGVKLTLVYEPLDQYFTKMFASIAAGAPTTDMAWINPTYAAQMMGNGQLESVQDLFDSGRVDKSNYPAGALQSYTWENVLYCVPKDAPTVCLIYNKRIFDEAGVPYPTDDWTWDDVVTAGLKLVKKDANGTTTRYAYTHNSSAMSSWFPYVYTFGGSLYDPDNNGGNYANTPENLAAWQMAADMIFKHKITPDANVTTEMSVDELFINEMTAMTAYVPAQIERYANALGGENIGVAQFPHQTQKATIMNCLGWGIAKGVKNLEAAKTVMEFLGSREGQEPQASVVIPAYMGITTEMEKKYSNLNFRAYADSTAFAIPTPVEQYMGNAARVLLETEINYISTGEKTPAQGLADAEAAIRAGVAAEKARRGIN